VFSIFPWMVPKLTKYFEDSIAHSGVHPKL
jgi:hypothetical protein